MFAAPLTSVDFRRALGQFATGVTVVTVECAPHRVHGMTANSLTSVSLVPPLISVCVAEHAHLLPLLKEKRMFGINVLKQEQQHLSEFSRAPISRKGRGEHERKIHLDATEYSADGECSLSDCLPFACDAHCWRPHHRCGRSAFRYAISGQPLLFFRGEYTRSS
jgi:hypothetical protein